MPRPTLKASGHDVCGQPIPLSECRREKGMVKCWVVQSVRPALLRGPSNCICTLVCTCNACYCQCDNAKNVVSKTINALAW